MLLKRILLASCVLAALPLAAEAKRPNSKLNGIEIERPSSVLIRPSHSGDMLQPPPTRETTYITIPPAPTTILDWWMGPMVGTHDIEKPGLITPAVYKDRGLRELMVGIPLAGYEVAEESREVVGAELERWGIDAAVAAGPSENVEAQLRRMRAPEDEIQRILELHNPQGWHIMGKRIQEFGWEAMDQFMLEFEALDPPVKTVWFWNWSGVDAYPVKPEGATIYPMGWPDINALPPHLVEGWNTWRKAWEERGFRFGVWLSTPAYPNTGTWDKPVRKWLKYLTEDGGPYIMDRNDPNANASIPWFLDKMAELHQVCGFDFIGMDAANHLFELRDQPPHRQLNYQPAGPREPGITQALFYALNTDPRLRDCQFIAESHLPPNILHALMPTLFAVSGEAGPKNKLSEIDAEEHHKIIPGCEVVTHMQGLEWTQQEWPTGAWPGPVYQELLDRGYTPTIAFPLLNERVLTPAREAGTLALAEPPTYNGNSTGGTAPESAAPTSVLAGNGEDTEGETTTTTTTVASAPDSSTKTASPRKERRVNTYRRKK